MRQLLSISAMVLAAGLIAGCSSMQGHNGSVASANDPSSYNRGMAGGDGAFGEDPQNPGVYSNGATVAAHHQTADNVAPSHKAD